MDEQELKQQQLKTTSGGALLHYSPPLKAIYHLFDKREITPGFCADLEGCFFYKQQLMPLDDT